MTKLRECPFCGGDELMIHQEQVDGCTYVFCPACDSSGPRAFASESAAIRSWNNRSDTRYTITPKGRAILEGK